MTARMLPHVAGHGAALGITLAALPLAAVLVLALALPAVVIAGRRAGL